LGRIRRAIFVNHYIGISSNRQHQPSRKPNKNKENTKNKRISLRIIFLFSITKSEYEKGNYYQRSENSSRVKGQPKRIYHENFSLTTECHRIRQQKFEYEKQNSHHRYVGDDEVFNRNCFVVFKIVKQSDRRNGQECHKVYSERKPYKQRYS